MPLEDFGGSALTDHNMAVPTPEQANQEESEIPSTYVPARNTFSCR